MWRNEHGTLNTNAFGEPEVFLEPALELIDGEISEEGPRLADLVDGMVDLVTEQLLHEEWDVAAEAPYEREWMPDEALETALFDEPSSIAALLAATPLRWRLDLAMVIWDYVDSVVDPDEDDEDDEDSDG